MDFGPKFRHFWVLVSFLKWKEMSFLARMVLSHLRRVLPNWTNFYFVMMYLYCQWKSSVWHAPLFDTTLTPAFLGYEFLHAFAWCIKKYGGRVWRWKRNYRAWDSSVVQARVIAIAGRARSVVVARIKFIFRQWSQKATSTCSVIGEKKITPILRFMRDFVCTYCFL